MAAKESDHSQNTGEICNGMSQIHSKTFGFTVYFKVTESKPQELSKVVVISKEKGRLEFLESHLKNIKLNCEGAVMAQTLIQETETIFKVIYGNVGSDLCKSHTSNDGNNDSEITCKYFLKGKCRFGEKCFNSHGVTPTDSDSNAESLHNDLVDPFDENMNDSLHVKQDKKKTKCKNAEPEQPKKKTPMKTATDVINRIQWDEKLNPEDFSVGYLDRFLGIIENSFSSFDWEDITSVDQTILAIPQHRIQYFKYNDEVVWDKNKRLDCIFGSTGSGQTILDIIERTEMKEREFGGNN